MSTKRYRNLQFGPYACLMAEGEAGNENPPSMDSDELRAGQPTETSARRFADNRWKVRGVIAAAAVTAVIGGIVTLVHDSIRQEAASNDHTASQPTASQPTEVQASSLGTIENVEIGSDGVTVSGTAGSDVAEVYVLMGPQANGSYLAGSAPVASDKTWRVEIAPDAAQAPDRLKDYAITVYPRLKSSSGVGGSDEPGTPPCVSPECVSQLGPPARSGL